jgi:hypothetical protein
MLVKSPLWSAAGSKEGINDANSMLVNAPTVLHSRLIGNRIPSEMNRAEIIGSHSMIWIEVKTITFPGEGFAAFVDENGKTDP